MALRRLTDEQRDLVGQNFGLAIMLAKRFADGMEIEDAAQESALGFMDFAPRYDPSLGHRFSTGGSRRALGSILDAKRKYSKDAMYDHRLGRRSGSGKRRKVKSIVRDTGPHRDPHDPVEIAASREWHQKFYEALAGLDPRDQAIVRGRVEGKSTAEVAIEIGLSRKTTEQYTPRAFHRMAAEFCRIGGGIE